MKTHFSSISVCFVSLVCLVKYASSILCYDCNSAFDPRCGEEFDPFSLGVVNCSLRDPLEHIPPTEATICRTIKMEIEGKIRVVRQCGYLLDEETNGTSCRRQSGTGNLFTTYCSCDTDLCNSAAGKDVQLVLLGFALLSTVLLC